MNKKVSKAIAISLATLSVGSAASMVGCKNSTGGVLGGAETLQIFVSNFGYGVDWAYALVEEFKKEAWVQEKYPRLAIPEPTVSTIRTKPTGDIESTYADHDLYFSCDYAKNPLGESDGVRFYADLTDMYNTTIPGESVTVKENDSITTSDVIGTSGEIPCECAEKPHIHIEVYVDGKLTSPLAALGLE